MQLSLQQVEVRLRRWHTRLTRASNEVAKLEKKRRRLVLKATGRAVVIRPKTLADRSPRNDKGISGTVTNEIPLPELDAFFAPEPKKLVHPDDLAAMPSNQPKPTIDVKEVKRQVDAAIASDIPACLDRKNPVVVEQITAARKKREAEERKKMPLTGAAALKKIKSKK